MRRDAVIKLPQGPNAAQALQLVAVGIKASLAPQSATEIPQEILLVNPIPGKMQGSGRSGQVHSRRYRAHRPELRWRFPAPFSCQLQDQIAAHGEAEQG